jgi:hypothetical protein
MLAGTLWLAALFSVCFALVTTPSRTTARREQNQARAAGPFVTADGGNFQLSGRYQLLCLAQGLTIEFDDE